MIKREKVMKKLRPFMDKNIIKVLTGIRRSGKSVMLKLIQEVQEWEKCINSLLSKGLFDIYLTGSNANHLSSELATYVAGRYVEVHIYPFTFKEFIDLYERDVNHESAVSQYLKDIYSSVLIKDVMKRNQFRDVELLERIFMYVIAHVCENGAHKFYVQVTYLLASEETIEREFGVLLDIKDNFPKYVLSMDHFDLSREGIQHMYLPEFLLTIEEM